MPSLRNPRRKRHHSEDGTPQPEKKQCRKEPQAKLLTQNDHYSVTQPPEEADVGALRGSHDELCAFVGSGIVKGLLEVKRKSGKITSWDDVDRRRKSAEGSCGALLPREVVSGLEEAGTGGFVLTFSSGRSAQLVLTDAQSRPSITVTFLRGRGSKGGFFGGLSNVLGSASVLKPIAAARHRPVDSRDKAQVMIGTEDATFQYWQLSWLGQPLNVRELNVHTALEEAASTVSPSEATAQMVTLLDFVITSDTTEGTDLLTLVSFTIAGRTMFALVELEIDLETTSSRRVILLHSYTDNTNIAGSWRPRLHLPSPGHTAFVAFENAVTLVTISQDSPSPDLQLLMDAGQAVEPFQDTVHFRIGNNYTTADSSAGEPEPGRRSSSVLLHVTNFGTLRLTAEEPYRDASEQKSVGISIKERIEQAVFFGSMSSNPLNLTRRSDETLDLGQLEEAALEVSREIINTRSRFSPQVSASMSDHLEKRAEYLVGLASYILSLSTELSRATRWQLRCDAEQLAACKVVWSLYDKSIRGNYDGIQLLPMTVFMIHPDEKTTMDRKHGEADKVRTWCTRDVSRMHTLFEHLLQAPDTLQKDGTVRDPEYYMNVVNEANAFVVSGLQAAYESRMENARLYGLTKEPVRKTILLRDYKDLPALWTSHVSLISELHAQFSRVHNTVYAAMAASDGAEVLVTSVGVMFDQAPDLVDTFCRACEERVRWQEGTAYDEQSQSEAEEIEIYYVKTREKMIKGLLALGHLDAAAGIAEMYEDMPALVEITKQKIGRITKAKGPNLQPTKLSLDLEKELNGQLKQYFQLFNDNDEWAQESFSSYPPGYLLRQAGAFKEELSRFLRSDASYGKLQWINDVVSEHDYLTTAETLTNVARDTETSLWNKKVELSIAKLAIAASNHERPTIAPQSEDEMQLVKIQEMLYEHIRPCFYEAVDEDAEAQLAMETYGKCVSNSPSLAELLEDGLAAMIRHEALSSDQLIDVLTLMDDTPCSLKEHDISRRRFYLALMVLRHGGFGSDRQTFDMLLRLTWQRCYSRDDWDSINDTGSKVDEDAVADLEATTLYRTIYEGQSRGLFEVTHGVRILAPSKCAGAGTTPEEHYFRFQDTEVCKVVARDILGEDKQLRHLISSVRLEHWVDAARDLAQRKLKEADDLKKSMADKVGGMVNAVHSEQPNLQPSAKENGASHSWQGAVQRGLGL